MIYVLLYKLVNLRSDTVFWTQKDTDFTRSLTNVSAKVVRI